MDQAERRIGFQPLDQRAGGRTEGARGVGLAHAVLDGVRPGVVAAHLHDDLAVAADHGHRYGVAIGLAGLYRGFRDGYGDGSAQVLVAEQFRSRGRGEGGGKDTTERERAAAECGSKHLISPPWRPSWGG